MVGMTSRIQISCGSLFMPTDSEIKTFVCRLIDDFPSNELLAINLFPFSSLSIASCELAINLHAKHDDVHARHLVVGSMDIYCQGVYLKDLREMLKHFMTHLLLPNDRPTKQVLKKRSQTKID